MSISENLKKLREKAGLTQGGLAAKANVSQGTISQQESNPTMQSKYLPQIAKALGVEVSQIIDGSQSVSKPLAVNEELAKYDTGQDKYAYVAKLENSLGAGRVELNEFDEIEGRHAFRRDWLKKNGWKIDQLRVLNVSGNSQSPYINDGDVVLVNLAEKNLIDGEYYAIRIGTEARIKRLYQQIDGRIRVESLNAPPEYLTEEIDAEIMGRVVHRAG